MSQSGDDSYEVVGDLTINGHTQTETLTTTFFGTETFPMDGSTRAGFEATGRIDRTACGIDFNVPLAAGGLMLANNVDVVLHAQLVAPTTE